jgi:ketosteroid isomerase-like protein
MPEQRTGREVAELARQRLAAVDMSGFTDLFAEDALFEYPFGYAGAPSEIRGREALRAHLVESRRGLESLLEVKEFNAVVHDTTDPAVAIAEWEVAGTTLATGQPFRFPSGVGVITVQDGEITHYRDYTNPLGAAAATGRLAEFAASLAGLPAPEGQERSDSPAWTDHGRTERTARAGIEALFRVTLANSADELAGVFAPDVVIDLPFAPPGRPTRYVGLAGLQERWAAVQQQRRFTRIDEVVIHETPDPEVVISEYRVHGESGGDEFALRYLMVSTVRDGTIVASRDYSDIVGAMRAYGQLPQLAAALSQA